MKKIALFILLVSFYCAAYSQQSNRLTTAEKKGHWTLLFNGKNTTGWHTYLKPDAGAAWKVSNGTIELDPEQKEGRGDLVSNKEYENFELAFQWNISEEGNSGLIFLVHEAPEYHATYETGPEYQLLDDQKAEDNKKPNHLAGSLYDLIAPATKAVKPAGEWNESRIRLENGHLTFWLNGKQVVETNLWTENWKTLLENSKFKGWKGFAAYHKGRIALQDHGHKISFKNIRIKEL